MPTAASRYAEELKKSYDIVVPNIDTPVRLLSGGNLQRVILAREISSAPELMIAMQPTRGLDVGAIEGVHRLLLAQRESGAAILLISEELEELSMLSDRVAVIYEGQIMGEVTDGNVRRIGQMMTGTRKDQIEDRQDGEPWLNEACHAKRSGSACPSGLPSNRACRPRRAGTPGPLAGSVVWR